MKNGFSKPMLFFSILAILIFSFFIFILGAYLSYSSDRSSQTTTQNTTNQSTETATVSPTPNTNPDGTSKAPVYTKASDFGNYSDWAQKQLQRGVSVCHLQNNLAQTDPNVPIVPNCDFSHNISCTTTNAGIMSTTNCSTP